MAGSSEAACNINQTFSCDDVARSPYSELFSIPVAVYGMAYFGALFLVVLLGFFSKNNRERSEFIYRFLVAIGILVSLILFSISGLFIGTFCMSCLASYAITFLQGGILMPFRHQIPASFHKRKSLLDLTLITLVVFLFLAVYLAGKDHLKDMIPVTYKEASYGTYYPEIDNLKDAANTADFRLGPLDAKVTIVHFVDFRCPICKMAAKNFKKLHKEFGDKIQFIFKNFPLDATCNDFISQNTHPKACDTAILARCAGEKGLFWQFHDEVFAVNAFFRDDEKVARGLGLSEKEMESCRQKEVHREAILKDIKLAVHVGLTGTPMVFINGVYVSNNRQKMRAKILSILGGMEDKL